MMPSVAPFQAPGPQAGTSWGSGYDPDYPIIGLGGLMQGLAHGLTTGQQLAMHRDQMANEADWRRANLQQATNYHAALLSQREPLTQERVNELIARAARERAQADAAGKPKPMSQLDLAKLAEAQAKAAKEAAYANIISGGQSMGPKKGGWGSFSVGE